MAIENPDLPCGLDQLKGVDEKVHTYVESVQSFDGDFAVFFNRKIKAHIQD